jgi:hypothetical protein
LKGQYHEMVTDIRPVTVPILVLEYVKKTWRKQNGPETNKLWKGEGEGGLYQLERVGSGWEIMAGSTAARGSKTCSVIMPLYEKKIPTLHLIIVYLRFVDFTCSETVSSEKWHLNVVVTTFRPTKKSFDENEIHIHLNVISE